MRVIAIDPGYDRCGIAVMEHNGKNGTLLFSTCVVTDRKADFPARLFEIGQTLTKIIKTHSPDALALERLYFNTNQKTALQVAEVRGLVLYLAGLHGCRILEYTPQEVKVAVTGYGKSDKKQVALMVARLVTHVPTGLLDDEYDAIAIAMTALVSVR